MKKKFLLGLGVGALMATTPFITACSSDITFNQSDLDNALININDYLETQNNYNSEFAKNVLNDYLLRGIERNQDNSQFSYKCTNEIQNALNDCIYDNVLEYKMYRQDNKIKELLKVTGDDFHANGIEKNTINYRELTSEYKQTIVEPGVMSIGKTHYYSGTIFCEEFLKTTDQYYKTTCENKTIDQLTHWMLFGDISSIYSDVMLAIVCPEASSFGVGDYFSNQTDVVMGQEGEFETFTFTNVFAEIQSGQVFMMSYNIKFKNGILHSVAITHSMKDDYADYLYQSQTLTIEITEKIEDFTFDKAPY